MYFLVILAFVGPIAGETFFHHHENGNFTLSCSEPVANGEKRTLWYQTDKSLQIFSEIKCNTKRRGTNQQCGNTNCTVSTSPCGGVFACAPCTNTGTSQTVPLLTNMNHCRRYNFFIVAIINTTADSEMFENICAKSHDDRFVQEKSNITLSCEFKMKIKEQPFIIYWIKHTETSKCLSCIARMPHTSNFSYNEHCCIDEMIKGRLWSNISTVSHTPHIVHNITILNVTYSDSGTYLCVVNSWYSGKHVWKISNNLSIEVRNQTMPSSASVALYATPGLIIGIILIGGIAWLIYKKKIKSKGNPSAQLPRAQDAIEIPGDECSPYAMCSSKDMQRNEVLYSLATRPYEDPNAAYSVVDNTTASGKGPGDEIHSLYSSAEIAVPVRDL